MTFRSILCPVDFSDCSREALRFADDIAHRTGGRLSVVYVNDPTLWLASAAALHRSPHFLRRTQAELERFVDESIAADPRPPCRVWQGRPANEILQGAKRYKHDLIVMGTHGLTGFDRLFFGSTTDHVLRRVTVPLLAVPPPKTLTRSRPGQPGRRPPIARILVPLDLEGAWNDELGGTIGLARIFGAELSLLYVVPRTMTPPWLRENTAAYDRKRLTKARRALQQIRAEIPGDVRATTLAVIGKPASEIAAAAAKLTGLLVMALRRGLRARSGSITQQVLTQTAAPVLVLPR